MRARSRRDLLRTVLYLSLVEISRVARAADPVSELHAACVAGDTEAVKRLLASDPKLVNQRTSGGITPLLIAVSEGSAEIVHLLLDAGAKRDACNDDGQSPMLLAITLLFGGDSSTSREGAKALLDSVPVSVQATDAPLHDVLTQVFIQAGVPADVETDLKASITATLNLGLDTALSLLLRTSRTAGQPISITLTNGRLKIGPSSATSASIAPEVWPVLITDPHYRFDRTISRAVLNAYLSRAVSHFGLLSSSPEPATSYFDDDLRMLVNIGAKFVGNSAYSWEPPDDDEAHFRLAAERAARVHAAAPEMLLQAAVFETAYRKVERIPVPDWVFAEFGLRSEKRTFRYEAMLYDGGKLRDHWMHDASVPDMTKLEARLWFYYRARRYIDSGCEAIHFGQVHLMDQGDPGHYFWDEILTRIRRYAQKSARRRFLLCAAHTHGVILANGNLLFDHHAWPLRPAEARGGDATKLPCEMRPEFGDSIIRHSRGGRVTSGWSCVALPYLVEFDNFGVSGKPGQPGGPLPWIWGYDEISWFAHLNSSDRDAFLRYAYNWLRQWDPDGFLQIPTRRVLAASVDGQAMYQANHKSDGCPIGFGQEDAIKALWAGA